MGEGWRGRGARLRGISGALGNGEIMGNLQVQPEAGGRAEAPRQQERSLSGDRPLAAHDLGDAIGRDAKITGKLACR